MKRLPWLAGLIGFLMLLVIGALALVAGQPLLFPSLGPTVFMQTQRPRSPAARSWNILVGHAVGVAAAVFSLAVTGAAAMPSPIITGTLSWQRELASALAVGLTIAVQVPLRASHAPAAATTLLITLGAINPEWRAILVIGAGVILTAVMGEPARIALERMTADRSSQPAPRSDGPRPAD